MSEVRYAFTFDASACTGCKACQVACKDKNQLPTGILWRRLYEVSGGSWRQEGAAWSNTVFAYNVSMACNHCADPACAAACPTGAYLVRGDGIVYQEPEKCLGCEYCSWACPYGAPQYSPDRGRTTKCDLCRDLLDEGLPPACVAACPMRALEVVEIETPRGAEQPSRAEAQSGVQRLWQAPAAEHPFPLPATSRTEPYVAIKPHRAMANDLARLLSNREEVRPATRLESAWWRPGEWPLVAFTLLGQAAAGVACISLFTGLLSPGLFAATGALLVAAALSSLLHLGSPLSPWRATANARASRLSREIIVLALFGVAWFLALVAPRPGHIAMAVCGAGLVSSMAQVYRLDGVPPWNTWRTFGAFAASALLLGLLTVALAATVSGRETAAWSWPLAGALLALEAWLAWAGRDVELATWQGWRVGLITVAMIAIAVLLVAPPPGALALAALVLVAALAQEVLGRRAFYAAADQRSM